ncbi:MAG: DUF4153 domain-containing protein [Alkalibacterium sp.]|nr:DUF4153 domain-containing protein [Alkalibacterium sp.]
MNKMRIFDKLKERGMHVFRRFPLAIFFILAATISSMLSIQMDQNSFTREAVSSGLAAILFATGHLAVEGVLAQKKKWHLPLFASVFILSLLYYVYLLQTDLFTNEISFIRTLVLYFIVVVAFIAVPTIKSRFTFSETLVAFITSLFSSLLIAVVFYIGVAAILGAFSTLFTPLSFEWFGQAAALIFIFFAPAFFLSGLPVYNEERETASAHTAVSRPTLLSFLVDFIIVPLLLIFSVLLIAYIGINITGEFWLDNLIEPMLISYVSIGFITLFLTEYSSKPWVTAFNRYFPYLLLVIAIFQSVSSSIKSFELGLTHGRYFVLLFGIFAISGVLIYAFFRSFKKVIPFILVALGVVSVLPLVDAVSIGIASQVRQVNTVVDEEQLDDDGRVRSDVEFSHEDRVQISYSFNYLEQTNALDRLEWLPDNFNYYNQFEQVFGFDPYYYANYDSDGLIQDPSANDYAYIELDETIPLVLPVTEFDDVIFFATYWLHHTPGENRIDLNEPDSEMIITADGSVLTLEIIQDEAVVMNFDLSFLQDEIYVLSESSQTLTLDELSFTEENEEVKVTVVVNRLETDSTDYLGGAFTVLIDYK